MLLAASCSSDESLDSRANLSNEQVLVPVTVRVADFSVSQEEFPEAQGTRGANSGQEPQETQATTRAAQAAAAYAGVKAITLAFYKTDGTEAYKHSQLRASLEEGETFGEFSTSLAFGSYTMVVLGYGLNDGEPAVTLTSPTVATFGDYPARETFAATQAVNISNADAVDLSATPSRIVSKLHVVSSDVRTAETLDEDDNVLFSKTIEDVPFKCNRVTNLAGAMYSDGAAFGTFQFETDWLTEANVNF